MYKKLNLVVLVSVLFMSATSMLTAQKDDAPVRKADQMPTLKDCPEDDQACTREKMMAFVGENLKFPKAAKEAETGGAVMVSYVIEKNGSIGDIVATVDPGMGMGAEAVRVVELMNKSKMKWRPGLVDGKKVRVQMILPVQFNMELEKEPEEVTPAKLVNKEDEVLMTVEDMPRFNGCDDESKEEAQRCTFNGLIKHIQTNLKYPEKAKATKEEGMVLISFVVDKSGKVRDVEVVQPLSPECDAEAVRVVKAMPVWTPGMQDGEKRHVRMNLPIQFRPGKE